MGRDPWKREMFSSFGWGFPLNLMIKPGNQHSTVYFTVNSDETRDELMSYEDVTRCHTNNDWLQKLKGFWLKKEPTAQPAEAQLHLIKWKYEPPCCIRCMDSAYDF